MFDAVFDIVFDAVFAVASGLQALFFVLRDWATCFSDEEYCFCA